MILKEQVSFEKHHSFSPPVYILPPKLMQCNYRHQAKSNSELEKYHVSILSLNDLSLLSNVI